MKHKNYAEGKWIRTNYENIYVPGGPLFSIRYWFKKTKAEHMAYVVMILIGVIFGIILTMAARL